MNQLCLCLDRFVLRADHAVIMGHYLTEGFAMTRHSSLLSLVSSSNLSVYSSASEESMQTSGLSGSEKNLHRVSFQNVCSSSCQHLDNSEQEHLEDASEKMDSLKRLLAKVDTLKQAKAVAVESACKRLSEQTDLLVNHLHEQHARLQDEIHDAHSKDISDLDIAVTKIQQQMHNLCKTLQDLENNAMPEYQVVSLSPAKEVDERLSRLVTQLEHLTWKHRNVVQFTPCGDEDKPDIGFTQTCHMSEDFKKVTKLRICSMRQTTLAERPQVKVKRSKSEAHLHSKPKESLRRKPHSNPVPLYCIRKYGQEAGCLAHPVDTVFLPNGHLIVGEKGNNRLQEFDPVGQHLRIHNRVSFRPLALTMTHDNYIAMLDSMDKNVKIFTRGGELMCKFGTGYFKEPMSLTATATGQFVVVDSYGPWQQYAILYHPMTGKLNKLGYDADGNYVLSHPEYVSMDMDDNVIISDSGNHCVWTFSTCGRLLTRWGTGMGEGDGQLCYPKGVVQDQQGNLLVADCGNHRICLYNKDGKFLRHVLTSKDGLSYPQTVNISSTGTLAVTQNGELLVFEM